MLLSATVTTHSDVACFSELEVDDCIFGNVCTVQLYHMMLFVVKVDGVQVEPIVTRETRPQHKVIEPSHQGLFTLSRTVTNSHELLCNI